jgi:hypothetical protein
MPSLYLQVTGDMLVPGTISGLTVGRGHGLDVMSIAVLGLFCNTVMRHIMMFWSTTDRIYSGGPIIL